MEAMARTIVLNPIETLFVLTVDNDRHTKPHEMSGLSVMKTTDFQGKDN